MRGLALGMVMAGAAAVPLTAFAQTQPPVSSKAIAAADPQSLKVGSTTIVRPFGSVLVDRVELVGSYRLAGRPVHLVRGDTGTAPCRTRYVFVTEPPRTAPVATAPFGNCGTVAQVTPGRTTLTVALATPAVGGVPGVAQFLFDGASVRPLDGRLLGQVTPVCLPAAKVPAATQIATVDAFARDFPVAWRTARGLRRDPIDPVQMRGIVTALACLAPWPAAEERVPQLATPLFASRHADAAFASLNAIAVDPTSDPHLRASARAFAAEMTYRVGRREPL